LISCAGGRGQSALDAGNSRAQARRIDNKALFAKWALALFIVGILGGIFILALSPNKELAVAFLGVCWLLALVFGIVGWRHTAGKVAVFGVVGLFVRSSSC
jgi:hypothetical protein